jgi:hypothetical protein
MLLHKELRPGLDGPDEMAADRMAMRNHRIQSQWSWTLLGLIRGTTATVAVALLRSRGIAPLWSVDFTGIASA